jgi:pheromone shutdown protein TraB
MEIDVTRAQKLMWSAEDQAKALRLQMETLEGTLVILHEELNKIGKQLGVEMGTRSGGGGK